MDDALGELLADGGRGRWAFAAIQVRLPQRCWPSAVSPAGGQLWTSWVAELVQKGAKEEGLVSSRACHFECLHLFLMKKFPPSQCGAGEIPLWWWMEEEPSYDTIVVAVEELRESF